MLYMDKIDDKMEQSGTKVQMHASRCGISPSVVE